MGMSELLKEYITDTAKLLVDNPNEVKVNVSVSTKNVIIQVGLNKKDFGKIIGKNGRTIESLKVIILAIKNTKFSGDTRKISLEILEDENSSYQNLKKTTNLEEK